MRLKALVGVSILAVICFFLPSVVIKLWEWLRNDLWNYYRSWLIYPFLACLLIFLARRRYRSKLAARSDQGETRLLFLVKERLAKGEITIDEFHVLRQELFSPAILNQLEE